jgi:hypothetical protein
VKASLLRQEAGMGYLDIYLNDHLAGSTVGLELGRRAAGAARGSPEGDALDRLVEEIAEDRRALLEVMAALGVPVRHYKIYAAWVAEKVGRVKPNGHVRARSPLSGLLELEVMRLGVEGKGAGWRTLRTIAEHDDRIEISRLDGLIARAARQADILENLRIETANRLFGE